MAKTINIYLTKDQREQLKKIMMKNHVSTTTICDKITWITYKYTRPEFLQANKDQKKLMEGYMQKTTGIKTSIKVPQCMKKDYPMANILKGKESMFITNATYLYITKEIKNWLTDDALNMYYNEINEQLTKAKEQFYNYNNFVRSTRRAIRENKEYYKKAIAQEENK